MEEQAQETKLDFKTKFFYGFGSISFGIKNNGFSFFCSIRVQLRIRFARMDDRTRVKYNISN